MFDIVVASETPWVSRALVPYLKTKYPEASTLVFNLGRMGALRFAYPRGGEYTSYPRLSAPNYQVSPAPNAQAYSLREYLEAEARNSRPYWQTPGLDDEALFDALKKAKHFVFAADPNPGTAHGYCRLLEYAGVSDVLSRTEAYIFYALDEGSLEKAFNQNSREDSVDFLAKRNRQGEVKRYFEWNWNHNALVVMRSPLQAVGLPANSVISKFELQLLYFLARHPDGLTAQGTPPAGEHDARIPPRQIPWTEGNIVSAMTRWKGSGKYERQRLGSCTSYDSILTQLQEKQFLVRNENKKIRVTRKGFEFLGLVHPDCEDPDLPARLNNWMEQGLDTCKPAIDRYIRTFFGKQIRFFGKRRFSE